MSILDRVKSAMPFMTAKAAVADPKEARTPPPLSHALFGMQDTELASRQAWLMYKQIAPVAKVIDLIAEKVSSLGIIVKVNGDVVEGHEIEAFLHAPGYNRAREQLVRELAQQILATGTGYLVSYGREGRMPLAVDVLHTRDRNIITDYSDGWPGIVQFHEEGRQLQFSRQGERDSRYISGDMQELITFYEAGGDIRGTGLSKLNAVRTDVELRLMGMEHNRSLLGQGARISGNLHYKGDLTQEQMKALTAQAQSMMGGASNAGKIMITSGGDGSDFKSFMQTAQDMDYTNLVKIVEESTAARFGVPSTLYSVDAQTHNNYAVAWQMLYDNAVLPLFKVIYGQLARHMSQRLNQPIEIEHDKLSSMVLADKAVERAAKLASERLITTNEAREEIGYEPMAGGDMIYDLPGMVPQYEDLFLEGEVSKYLEDYREGKALRVVN